MTLFLLQFWLGLLSLQTNQFILHDETGQIDAQIVQDAAAPLIEEGTVIAVFVMADATTSFDALLKEHHLLVNNQLSSNVIAVFINSSDNTTEIRYGAKWRRAVAENQQSIYEDRLAPGVMTGAYNAGIVNALNEIQYTLTESQQATSSNLPAVSSGMVVIFGVALVLLSFIMWMFTTPNKSIFRESV